MEPDATAVLRMPLQQLNMIMMQQVDTCPMTEFKGNRFTAYSLCTNQIQKIKDVYMKLRLNHAEARHIACAWNILGVKEYESADWCDDGEVGAGEEILKVLTENKIQHRAIFVVRNCAGKLYQDRLNQYRQAAIKVIKAFPLNAISQKKQEVVEQADTEPKTYAGAVKSPPGDTQAKSATRPTRG